MNKVTTLQGTALEKFGFVHVTGLPTTDLFGEKSDHTIQARPGDFGKWDANNGVMVVMTTEGEVWLARMGEKTRRPDRYVDPKGKNLMNFLSPETDFENVLKELCPNGEGCGVPCSNGQSIDGNLILGGLADATEDFCGLYSPESKVKG